METHQRERAELYARLASIPHFIAFNNLKEWERLKLRDEIERVILPFVHEANEDLRQFAHNLEREIDFMVSPPSNKPVEEFSEDEIRRYCAEMLLRLVWELVLAYIPRLLRGELLRLSLTLELEWALENGALIERHKRTGVGEKVVRDLSEVLKHKPFPFRQCPICHSFFVPVKRQLYCAPACTYKGTEIARKESKREYMRDYMAKQRQKAKARQGRKEK